jgi:hypothetical protein
MVYVSFFKYFISHKNFILMHIFKGFAANLFSITTSPLTSNSVILESSTASYKCEIHVDKVTTTQITCWTP